jgi:hypothetical protein
MFSNILEHENHDNLLYCYSLAEKIQITNSFTFGSYCQNIKGLLKNSGNFGQNSPRHFVGMCDSKYHFVILSHRESFYTCAGCLLGAVV